MSSGWYPQRCRMVIHSGNDDRYKDNTLFIAIDPSVRWREGRHYRAIKALCRYLIDDGIRLWIEVANRRWVILPDKDVEVADDEYAVIFPLGDGVNHEVFTFKDKASRPKQTGSSPKRRLLKRATDLR